MGIWLAAWPVRAVGCDWCEKAVSRMEAEGHSIPTWVQDMLSEGHDTFYQENAEGDRAFYQNGAYEQEKGNDKNISLARLKKKHDVIFKNTGASLIDIGDDVALLEFHSKSNAIGLDVIDMINRAVDETEKNYKGLVIGNQGKNFCVGANLALILMEAQDDNFFEIDFVIRRFQQAMMKVKYSDRPVVAAPFGMTLGGGTELCLPANRYPSVQ